MDKNEYYDFTRLIIIQSTAYRLAHSLTGHSRTVHSGVHFRIHITRKRVTTMVEKIYSMLYTLKCRGIWYKPSESIALKNPWSSGCNRCRRCFYNIYYPIAPCCISFWIRMLNWYFYRVKVPILLYIILYYTNVCLF